MIVPYPPMRRIQPRHGPAYTRCPQCDAQVTTPTGRRATESQQAFGLAVALARHKREKHPEDGDD